MTSHQSIITDGGRHRGAFRNNFYFGSITLPQIRNDNNPQPIRMGSGIKTQEYIRDFRIPIKNGSGAFGDFFGVVKGLKNTLQNASNPQYSNATSNLSGNDLGLLKRIRGGRITKRKLYGRGGDNNMGYPIDDSFDEKKQNIEWSGVPGGPMITHHVPKQQHKSAHVDNHININSNYIPKPKFQRQPAYNPGYALQAPNEPWDFGVNTLYNNLYNAGHQLINGGKIKKRKLHGRGNSNRKINKRTRKNLMKGKGILDSIINLFKGGEKKDYSKSVISGPTNVTTIQNPLAKQYDIISKGEPNRPKTSNGLEWQRLKDMWMKNRLPSSSAPGGPVIPGGRIKYSNRRK